MSMKSGIVLFVGIVMWAGSACAQDAQESNVAPPTDDALRAAASITPADYLRKIGVIAHDSMGGRDTPSPGLEMTAAWIAGEFERLGLTPGGDDGSYIQRYAIQTIRGDLVAYEFFELSYAVVDELIVVTADDEGFTGPFRSRPSGVWRTRNWYITSKTPITVVQINRNLNSAGACQSRATNCARRIRGE